MRGGLPDESRSKRLVKMIVRSVEGNKKFNQDEIEVYGCTVSLWLFRFNNIVLRVKIWGGETSHYKDT